MLSFAGNAKSHYAVLHNPHHFVPHVLQYRWKPPNSFFKFFFFNFEQHNNTKTNSETNILLHLDLPQLKRTFDIYRNDLQSLPSGHIARLKAILTTTFLGCGEQVAL